jgi:RNA polymerase sigma-70 factor (ECF subfamily)
MSADSSDPELVAAVALGDRRSLAELYDRHAPTLMAVGLRILGDRREVEDIVHDVFVEAWRAAGTYDPTRASVRTWLVMRMRSRALDRRKSAGVSRRVPMDYASGEGSRADRIGVFEDPAASADREVVRRVLATLPAEQRMVLELAYFEGLSSTEIAARAGTPVGTVKSRVAAALAKLRDGLAVERGGS